MGDKIELGEPDVIRNEDNILWLRAEIERLKREWDEDLKSMTLQWALWEEADKAKDAEIERLQAVVDAAREYISDHHNNSEQKLFEVLAALEGDDG